MDKKIVIFIAGLFSVILMAVVIFFVINDKVVKKDNEQKTVQNGEIEQKKEAEKIMINAGKESVPVNNVYRNNGETFDGGINFKENSDYSITYSESDQNFAIVILNPENVKDLRTKAENGFLQELGIGEEQACKLKVSLAVPYAINSKLAGKNYGLSFCPDGKEFDEIKGL